MDRFGAGRLLPFYQLPLAAFFLLLSMATTPWLAAFCMPLFGLTQGSQNTINTGFGAEFYGTRYLGSIRSAITAAGVLGSALGPGISGWLIDLGMNFNEQMPFIAAYHIAASILVWFAVSRARRTLPAAA